MKYLLSVFGFVCMLAAIFVFGGQDKKQESVQVCIVSNSSSSFDNKVQYEVKQAVCEFVGKSVQPEDGDIEKCKQDIEIISNNILIQNGCLYDAHCTIFKESLQDKNFITIQVRLGSGLGDSLLCVSF